MDITIRVVAVEHMVMIVEMLMGYLRIVLVIVDVALLEVVEQELLE